MREVLSDAQNIPGRYMGSFARQAGYTICLCFRTLIWRTVTSQENRDRMNARQSIYL